MHRPSIETKQKNQKDFSWEWGFPLPKPIDNWFQLVPYLDCVRCDNWSHISPSYVNQNQLSQAVHNFHQAVKPTYWFPHSTNKEQLLKSPLFPKPFLFFGIRRVKYIYFFFSFLFSFCSFFLYFFFVVVVVWMKLILSACWIADSGACEYHVVT